MVLSSNDAPRRRATGQAIGPRVSAHIEPAAAVVALHIRMVAGLAAVRRFSLLFAMVPDAQLADGVATLGIVSRVIGGNRLAPVIVAFARTRRSIVA